MLLKVVNAISIIISLAMIIDCGDLPIESAQKFTQNQPPRIDRFQTYPEDPNLLSANMPIEITVEASDPDGDPIDIEIIPEKGTYSEQKKARDLAKLIYYTPSVLSPGEEIIIEVRVSDSKKASISQRFSLGTKTKSPEITMTISPKSIINPSAKTSMTFNADCNGQFQVFVVDHTHATPPVFDENEKYFTYEKGKNAVINIDGPLSFGGDIQLKSYAENTVYIVFRDSFKLTSNIAVTILIDASMPTGQISINNNAEYTNTPAVSLQLTTDVNDIAAMKVSNYEDFRDAEWVPFSQTKEWLLCGEDGKKTVYVAFKDYADNITVYFDEITLDVNKPVIAGFTITSAQKTANRKVTINLAAQDSVGIASWLINETGNPADGAWVQSLPAEYILTSDYEQTIQLYVWAKDATGNISERMAANKTIQLVTPGSNDSNWNKIINIGGQMTYLANLNIAPSGNVYILGMAELIISDDSYIDVFIRKFDKNGTELNFAGSPDNLAPACRSVGNPQRCSITGKDLALDLQNNSMDFSYKFAIDSEENIYLAASSTPMTEPMAWILKKFDKDGNEISIGWDKKFMSEGMSEIFAIAIDSNDNIYVAGYGVNLVAPDSGDDWWLKKFDKTGQPKKFSNDADQCENGYYNPCTSDGFDFAYDAKRDHEEINGIAIYNNNIILYGLTENKFVGSSDKDSLIMKYNSAGQRDWQLLYDHFLVNVIAPDSEGNLYLGGYGNNLVSSASDSDWWIKKLNPLGQEIYFSGSSNGACTNTGDPDPKNNINPCSTNGLDLAYSSTYYIPNIFYGESVNDIAVNKNDELFFAGQVNFAINETSMFDFQLMKFTSSGQRDEIYGNFIFDLSQYDSLDKVKIDNDGNVYVTGTYDDSSVPLENTDSGIIKKLYY